MSALDKLLGAMLLVLAIPVLAFSLVLIVAWISLVVVLEAIDWMMTKEWRKNPYA